MSILFLCILNRCVEYSDFEGLAANIVKQANRSAEKLVQLILQYLPGFRDTSIYHGHLIHFYKRAQILVGDVWAAYGRRGRYGWHA